METLELVQFMLVFCISIIFTAFSVNRETPLTYLMAGICWVATGLSNYLFNPANGLPLALTYICVALGLVCFLGAFKEIGESVLDNRADRWRVGRR